MPGAKPHKRLATPKMAEATASVDGPIRSTRTSQARHRFPTVMQSGQQKLPHRAHVAAAPRSPCTAHKAASGTDVATFALPRRAGYALTHTQSKEGFMDLPMVEAQPSEVALDFTQTGGFGIRFLARLIDWVLGMVLGFVGGIIGSIALAILAAAGKVDPEWVTRIQAGNMFSGIGWGLVAVVLYGFVCEGIGGTTLGKLVLGFRVVNEQSEPCTPKAALLRNLAYFIDSLFFGLPAHSSMSNSALNQRLGDKWAHTVVVRRSALSARSCRPAGLVALGLVAGATANALCIALSIIAKGF